MNNMSALLNRLSIMMKGAENRRTLTSVYNDLNKLTASYEFIYVICYIMSKDMRGNIKKLYIDDPYDKASIKELQFITGLWLKNNNANKNRDVLIDTVINESILTRKLLDDLHSAIYVDPSIFFNNMDYKTSFEEILKKPEIFREAFFYSSEPAYEDQFLRFAPQKYIYDKDWLLCKNIDINKLILFYKRVYALLQNKVRIFSHIPNPVPEDYLDSWSFTPEEITNSFKDLSHIFDLLSVSLDSNVNNNFNDIGDFNILQEKPIIKLSNGNYFISSIYGISETIYYSPYYWMMQDEKYNKKATHNRGKSAENITYELLSKIKGYYSIYKNVIIKSNKGNTITDIDILLIYKNTAIVFQVKSKMLTALSRKGDLNAIESDYNKAIKSSYDQGLKCKECLLKSNKYTFDILQTGLKQIKTISNVYCISILLEGYPGIILQSQIIEKVNSKIFPIAISIFDIEIIIQYLNDIDKFIDYIGKREQFASQMIAENEIILLSRYLDTEFKFIKDEDDFLYDNSLAQKIDLSYNIDKHTSIISAKIERNSPCHCGSGLKYKRCHGKKNC